MSSSFGAGGGGVGDDGSIDPRLAAAQEAYAGDPRRLPEVLAALHHVRVLVPVVARPAERSTPTEQRAPVEQPTRAGSGASHKEADISLPLLLDGEGGRALLVFSCLESLAQWDETARPVPVRGPLAAAAGLAEGAEGLVLDIAQAHRATLGLPEMRALAAERAPSPAYADEALAASITAALAAEPTVSAAWLGPGLGVDATLTVLLDDGQDGGTENSRTEDRGTEARGTDARGTEGPVRVAARLADQLRRLAAGPSAVRGMDLTVTTAGAPPDAGRLLRLTRSPRRTSLPSTPSTPSTPPPPPPRGDHATLGIKPAQDPQSCMITG